jgi:imidazolonepropionase-like amidohydrolase
MVSMRASALLVPEASAPARQGVIKALRFGRIWMGDRVITNGTIVVTGDRITSIGTGLSVPAGAEVIDLRPFTALPGLIDLHTHMTYGWDGAPGTTPLRQGQRTPTERQELAAANARKTLATGVTTVRDLGAGGGLDITLRDEINAGRIVGPRLFVAGQGISAGRGGAPDPAAMQKTAESRLATPADWVKVYASRGSYQSVDTTQTITYDELKAIVDAAHAKGRKVAIHSYGASGVKDAVRAGADSVEHGIDLDAETIADMVQRGTVWVPTVDHNRYYVEAKDEFQFAPDTIPPLLAYIDKNLESVRRAFRGGVKIGMGSDAVYSMFGQNTRELGWFVKAGMTPEQALRTATTIGADLLGQPKELGRLAAGAFADIVAVEGDPLQRIDILFTGVRWVMKGGAVVVTK